jgi:hypothetical protein
MQGKSFTIYDDSTHWGVYGVTGQTQNENDCPRLHIDDSNPDNATNPPCLNFSYVSWKPQEQYLYEEGLPGGAPTKDSLLPIDAAMIDTKMDDGNPNTGRVTAYAWGTGLYSQCVNGSRYTISNTTVYTCTLLVDIGISTGVYPP